ncbi:MAG: hypothetical protein FVQ83_06865 [Chloroflexi bacterium]|nr:hypothetical protein [Chloroflexota bacterium]
MSSSHKLTPAILVLLFTFLACGPSSSEPTTSEHVLASSVAETMESQNSTLTQEPDSSVLPRSVYFLSDMGIDSFQVWRLDTEGITKTQITSEPSEVTDFDVSPLDGSVAYVVNNQLYFVDGTGDGRRLLVDGGPFTDDDDYYYRRRIGNPRWSPDGRALAFSQDGINLYQIADGTTTHMLTNEINVLDNDLVIPLALYFPDNWSPDGSRLLVITGMYEGQTLSVLTPATGDIVPLEGGMVCCYQSWTPDSRAVLVASPFIGMIDSGLWRFDAASGTATTLVPTTSQDGTLNFVGWPLQTPAGELFYFYTNLAAFPENEISLTLVSSALDGFTDRTPLRSEAMLFSEALWAMDGSLVLVVQVPPGGRVHPQRGPVVLVQTDGSPLLPIITSAYNLHWGP